MRRRTASKKTKESVPVDELDGVVYDTSEMTAEQIEQAERDMELAREDLLEDFGDGDYISSPIEGEDDRLEEEVEVEEEEEELDQ